MTFDLILDARRRHNHIVGRGRYSRAPISRREEAAHAVTIARRVYTADRDHNPYLADALLRAISFIEESRPPSAPAGETP